MKYNKLTVLGLILTASLALSLSGCSQNHSDSENQTVTESSEKKKNGKVAKALDISGNLLYAVAQTNDISTFLRSKKAPSEEDMYTEIQLPDSEEAVYLWAEVAENNDVNLKYYSEADTIITKISDYTFATGSHALKAVEIPYGTTEIGEQAFFTPSPLDYILIPSSVKKIGKEAFSGTTLKNIFLEEGLEEIGESAFKNTDVVELTIPSSVKTIGDEAFFSCDSLEKLQLNEGLEEIGEKAFSETALTEVTIPSTVKCIKREAFAECPITKLVIQDGVEEIGDFAFEGNRDADKGITELELPSSIKKIGRSAFLSQPYLTTLTLEEGIEEIGGYAFGSSPLEEVIIPTSVKEVGINAFKKAEKLIVPSGIKSLTGRFYSPNVTIQSDEFYIDEFGVGYNKDKTQLLFTTKQIEGAYTIPEGVISIANETFSGQSEMTEVIFPMSLESIGYSAFRYCRGLKEVVLSNNINSIGNSAFGECTNLTKATISGQISCISNYMFKDCENLRTVELGKNITEIEENSFAGCNNISEVYSYVKRQDIKHFTTGTDIFRPQWTYIQ